MQELKQILVNSKLTQKNINDNLLHPVLQTIDYSPRLVFEEIKQTCDIYFSTRKTVRMLGLAGLRGTGKTTLLWQTADYIHKNFTQNIYFFHIGHLKKYDTGIKELHEAFEKYVTKGNLSSYKKEIVILFDEIHEDDYWARDLKVLYDLFPSAFVVATGSSALLLQSTADLASRMLIQHVFPLSFSEFLNITTQKVSQNFEQKEQLKEILLQSKNISELKNGLNNLQRQIENYYQPIEDADNAIFDYISYRNITRFSLLQVDSQVDNLIIDLIKRVINEDIFRINDKISSNYSEKLLRRLAASDEISIQTLSQALGISQQEINENLDILVKAELLNVLYPHGGIDTKINKSQKYFFMSPAIRRVILKPLISKIDDNIYSKLLEDIVVLYLKRIFKQESIISFTSFSKGKNPDLLIETLDKPIIVEIGINKQTIKQITKSKIKYKYGIIINSKTDKVSVNEKDNVAIIPLKYFLLM